MLIGEKPIANKILRQNEAKLNCFTHVSALVHPGKKLKKIWHPHKMWLRQKKINMMLNMHVLKFVDLIIKILHL